MDARTAMRGYDALYAELVGESSQRRVIGRGGQSRVAVRPREAIVADLIAHCEAAHAFYEGKDAYRAAMYLRRAYLHRTDRHGDVFDGTDAIVWRRLYEDGKVGAVPSHLERESA